MSKDGASKAEVVWLAGFDSGLSGSVFIRNGARGARHSRSGLALCRKAVGTVVGDRRGRNEETNAGETIVVEERAPTKLWIGQGEASIEWRARAGWCRRGYSSIFSLLFCDAIIIGHAAFVEISLCASEELL